MDGTTTPLKYEESDVEEDAGFSDSVPLVDQSPSSHKSGPVNILHQFANGSHRKRLRFILALSAGWFGLQQIFTVFFGSGYFYLASLGFSDTLISFTWLSGPIAGMLFQPVVGAMSDNCTYSWGKRRPFLVVGTFVLICAMLSTAWAEEITASLLGFSNGGQRRDDLFWCLYIFVNICILIANFAIQPVQMGLRALVVDLVPTHQQGQAHAWIARLTLAGSMAGYYISSIDLTKNLDFLGRSQLQVLCSVVSINLMICVLITCYCVQEERPQRLDVRTQPQSAREFLLSFFSCLENLSVTRMVCTAQFFCWLGWFPFLYYTAKYVGGIQRKCLRPNARDPAVVEGEISRTGSFAMLIFSSASLFMTIILPLVVETSDSRHSRSRLRRQRDTCYSMRRFCSLRRTWLTCQIIFGICMMSTFFIDRVLSAYALVAAIGLPWAAGTWIPITLIAKELRSSREDMLPREEGDDEEKEDLAAMVIGAHNSAISAPQILAGLGSSLLFFIAGSGKGDAVRDGLEVWLLRAGGLSALGAAWFIKKLPKES